MQVEIRNFSIILLVFTDFQFLISKLKISSLHHSNKTHKLKHMKADTKKPNILILITDQQRSIQHFPEGWAEKYLPWTTYLKDNGVTFENNMCSSTACSPSRSTIFSSTYPIINGVLKVNDTIQMSRTLPMGGSLVTLGKIMTEAGYNMVYKGKWHLDGSFASNSYIRPQNQDRMLIEDDAMENHYDFPGWTSPDLGTTEAFDISSTESVEPSDNCTLNSIGGGTVDNDNRIVNGPMFSETQECAVDFIKNYDSNSEKPFCLVVSLANPHDIWVYPYTQDTAGYTDPIWTTEIYDDFQVPPSYEHGLDNKPKAQQDFLNGFQNGPLDSEDALNYVKFYAYLQTIIDDLTGDIIKALQENSLEEDTFIVRLSDHGEMSMAQGGLRQKENNIYKETISVPMIYTNPSLKQGEVRDDLVSLIDLMPTLAEIAGAEIDDHYSIQGESYAQTVLEGKSNEREYNYFATDDCGASSYTCIRGLIGHDYKYAVYYAASYGNPDYGIVNFNGEIITENELCGKTISIPIEYELYDYSTDGGRMETENLLHDIGNLDANTQDIWEKLHSILTDKMKETFTIPENWSLTTPEAQTD